MRCYFGYLESQGLLMRWNQLLHDRSTGGRALVTVHACILSSAVMLVASGCSRQSPSDAATKQPSGIAASADSPGAASNAIPLSSSTSTVKSVSVQVPPAMAKDDYIPEVLDANSDPTGVIKSRIELQQQLNGLASQISQLSADIRKKTLELYRHDSELCPLVERFAQNQKRIEDRITNAPGRKDAEANRVRCEKDLKLAQSEMKALVDEHTRSGCADHSAASDLHSRMKAKQAQIADVEKQLLAASKVVAMIADEVLIKDSGLASLREAQQELHKQIEARLAANKDLQSLKEKQSELIAKKKELYKEFGGQRS
jgi:hypothetical protein